MQPKDHEDSAAKQRARLFGQTAEYLRNSASVDSPCLQYMGPDMMALRKAVAGQMKATLDTTAVFQDWKHQLAGDAFSRLVADWASCAFGDVTHSTFYGVNPWCPFREVNLTLSYVTLPRWLTFLALLVLEQSG
jgi:hypothetical protein